MLGGIWVLNVMIELFEVVLYVCINLVINLVKLMVFNFDVLLVFFIVMCLKFDSNLDVFCMFFSMFDVRFWVVLRNLLN